MVYLWILFGISIIFVLGVMAEFILYLVERDSDIVKKIVNYLYWLVFISSIIVLTIHLI